MWSFPHGCMTWCAVCAREFNGSGNPSHGYSKICSPDWTMHLHLKTCSVGGPCLSALTVVQAPAWVRCSFVKIVLVYSGCTPLMHWLALVFCLSILHTGSAAPHADSAVGSLETLWYLFHWCFEVSKWVPFKTFLNLCCKNWSGGWTGEWMV